MASSRKQRRLTNGSRPTIIYVPEKSKGVRRLLRTSEACAYAHLSKRTLFRLIDRKIIKAYKHGSKLMMVDQDSIDSFLNSLPEAKICR